MYCRVLVACAATTLAAFLSPGVAAQPTTEPPIEHNYTVAWRGGFHAAYADQGYVAQRVSTLGPGGDVTRSGGVVAAMSFSYRRVHAEIEAYLDSKATLVDDSLLTEVESGQASIGGWLRVAAYEKTFGPPGGSRYLQNRLSILPGASVAYTAASVDAWPRDFEDPPRPLLKKKEATFALGVLVEVLFYRGIGATIDYRYRFARMRGATPENEGTAIFPTPAEFDFTGHMITVGLEYRAPFNLFRR